MLNNFCSRMLDYSSVENGNISDVRHGSWYEKYHVSFCLHKLQTSICGKGRLQFQFPPFKNV
jgi:ribosomal protein S26